MNKKNIIILVVVVIVIGGIVWLLATGAIPSPKTQEGTGTPQGTAVAPGTSAVTEEGQVVTQTGEPVKLDVEPGTPEAPQQSNPVSPEDLPSSAIELTMTSSGITPNSFEVRSGDAVTVSVTAGDSQTHVFKFDDASLSAVAVGVGPGETRAITFNAPAKGSYGFHCDVPGHAGRGETGTMTVK
ncbi:MAG: cupredoxin domain-containing protein [Candidatus Jorgensenbacteria bacterium]